MVRRAPRSGGQRQKQRLGRGPSGFRPPQLGKPAGRLRVTTCSRCHHGKRTVSTLVGNQPGDCVGAPATLDRTELVDSIVEQAGRSRARQIPVLVVSTLRGRSWRLVTGSLRRTRLTLQRTRMRQGNGQPATGRHADQCLGCNRQYGHRRDQGSAYRQPSSGAHVASQSPAKPGAVVFPPRRETTRAYSQSATAGHFTPTLLLSLATRSVPERRERRSYGQAPKRPKKVAESPIPLGLRGTDHGIFGLCN